MSDHTPAPWKVIRTNFFNQPDAKNYISIVTDEFSICKMTASEGMQVSDVPDAAFIVKAVNAFDEMVSALEAASTRLWLLGGNTEARQIDALLDRISPDSRDVIDTALRAVKP